MFDQQDTVGLILAYKNPMSVYGTISAVRRLTLAIRKAGINPIIIVTGKQSYDVERSMSDFGVIFICGEDSAAVTEEDYIRSGLAVAQKLYKKVIIASTQYPLILPNTIHQVAHFENEVVITKKDERLTYPIKIEEKQMEYLLANKSEGIFIEKLKEIGDSITYNDTSDVGVIAHKKDGKISMELIAEHNSTLLQPYVITFMETEKAFFDKRILLLLKLIQEFSSVKKACKHMAMSYAKAWDALNYLEAMLGYQVVTRSHGGKKGGNTVLTNEGKRLIILFEEYEKRVKEYSRNCFSELFPEFWENQKED